MYNDIDHPSSDSMSFEEVLEFLEQELSDDHTYDDEDEEVKELNFNED